MGLGVAVGLAGLAVRHDAQPARTVCHLSAELHSFDESLIQQTGPLPGLSAKATGCAFLDLRYALGLVAALLGLLIVAAGFVWLMRRSRRAAASGTPWPVRRTMEAAASWIDARVPGGRAGSAPRLRGGYLAVLSVLLVVVAIGGAVSLWQSHQRSAQIHSYVVATAALTALKLPAGLQRTAACADTVCASSRLSPGQLAPILRRLLDGAPIPAVTALIPCPVGRCPVTVYGHFDGSVVVGNAFWHLLVVRNGKPPKGAVPLHPGLRVRAGHAYGYWYGSDVMIGTINPQQSD
jgi:hypothetical protein